MKILVIGDLHGRMPIIKTRDFDCMILVGDICDDRRIAPLYKKWFEHIKVEGDLYLEVDEFFESIGYDEKRMEKIERESLKDGRKVLEFLNKIGKPLYLVPGNWDQSYAHDRFNRGSTDYNITNFWLDNFLGKEINPYLIEGFENIHDLQFSLKEFGGVSFVGYGLSSGIENPKEKSSRSFTKKQLEFLMKKYNKILKRLDVLSKKRNKNSPLIFVSHNVPYNTKLDIIKDKNSYAYKKHVGSTVARSFILRSNPVLCFAGHVHEGKGKCKLGKTLVVNPGYGSRAQVLIDFDEVRGKVRTVKFLKS